MFYDPQQILNAAKAILPALPQLLDPATARAMKAQLETLLFDQNIAKIWETLDQSPQTQNWRTKYLNQEKITVTRSSSQLAGDMVPQPGIIYACPNCDYRDVVFLLGMDPDPCPNHPDAVLRRL